MFADGLRPRATLAAAMLGVVVLAGCDSVEERVAKHLARGAELAEAGEIEKAILEYRNAIRLEGNNVQARLELAKILEDDGRFAAAVQHYVVAVENDPENVDARVRLAQYMVVTKEIDRALEFAERAYELAPDQPDVLAVRASVAYQMGNKAMAIRLAQEAIQIEPLHPAANVVVITERVEEGALEEALAMTDAILEVNDDDLSLHLLKLRLFELSGRPEAAHQQLELIAETFPDIVSTRQALAQSYVRIGTLDKAEEQLRAIAELEPDVIDHKMTIVRFLGATQGLDAAVAELQRRIDAEEDKWSFQQALAQLYATNDRPADARALVEEVIAAGGESAIFAKVVLARYELTEEKRVEAEALVNEVLEADPTNIDALAIRGALQIERTEYDEAIQTLRTGLTVEPEDIRLLLLSGRAHLLNGNDALGADQLANATRVSNYRAEVAQEYVRHLLQRGRIDGAEAVLSEAARRAPDNRDLLTALAELRLRKADWVGAEAVAKQLRELDGGADVAEQVLAASLSGQERYEESLTILKSLSKDEATRQQTMTQLIQNMMAVDQGEEAQAYLRQILEESPGNLQARLLEASIAQSGGEEEKAVRLFEQILVDFPDNPEIYFIMHRIRVEQGDEEAAEQLIRDGIEKTGGDLRLRMQLATIAEREGDFDEAIEQYEAVFAAEPDSMIAANNLASMLSEHRANDPEQLARAKKIALRLKGTDVPQMKDTVGWTLYLAGDHKEALPYLLEAVEALPNSALVNYHVGMTFVALGDVVKGREYLERALERAEGTAFPHTETAQAALDDLPTAATVE